jgi:serine/threonine protein kinase
MIEQRSMLPIRTILHGTYRVEEYLSSGGFGNTYVVTNVQFDEAYALKEFFMKGISQREGQTTVSVSNADNQQQFESQREKYLYIQLSAAVNLGFILMMIIKAIIG